jgi:hypothetical protein
MALNEREVTPDERVRLIAWLHNADTQLALQIAQTHRPSLMTHCAWTREISPAVSQNFQSMMQGWDLHLSAIIKACTPPRQQADVGQEFDINEGTQHG